MSGWVDVGKADEIALGQPVLVDVDGTSIAVIRLVDGFHAIEDICTHDGSHLTGGCIEGDQIECPRHGARFSIRTGEALTAPAYEPTAVFPVRVVGGTVQVRDDRWD